MDYSDVELKQRQDQSCRRALALANLLANLRFMQLTAMQLLREDRYLGCSLEAGLSSAQEDAGAVEGRAKLAEASQADRHKQLQEAVAKVRHDDLTFCTEQPCLQMLLLVDQLKHAQGITPEQEHGQRCRQMHGRHCASVQPQKHLGPATTF